MPNINDSIIDFNDFNAEPQLLRDIQDGKAIAFYSFAHLLLNADGTPYTMSKGVQLSGNYDTLNALKEAFPNGNSNLYIVNEDSKIYYWNGADWVIGGGINVTYASTLELDSPSESTSGTLTSTQLNTLKSNTFTQIKLGNFIYRKEAVIGTQAIYRCITNDSLYVISLNTQDGSWVKTTQELPEQMWTIDDIPNGSINLSKLSNDVISTIPVVINLIDTKNLILKNYTGRGNIGSSLVANTYSHDRMITTPLFRLNAGTYWFRVMPSSLSEAIFWNVSTGRFIKNVTTKDYNNHETEADGYTYMKITIDMDAMCAVNSYSQGGVADNMVYAGLKKPPIGIVITAQTKDIYDTNINVQLDALTSKFNEIIIQGNLIDLSKLKIGYFNRNYRPEAYNILTQEESCYEANNNGVASAPIEVKGGSTIYIRSVFSGLSALNEYDENGNFIKRTKSTEDFDFGDDYYLWDTSLILQPTTKYITISSHKYNGNYTKYLTASYGKIPNDKQLPFNKNQLLNDYAYELINKNTLDIETLDAKVDGALGDVSVASSPLFGKSIAYFGDSLMHGAEVLDDATAEDKVLKGIWGRLNEKYRLNMTANNSKGGATIEGGHSDMSIAWQMLRFDNSNTDIVLFTGGFNDAWKLVNSDPNYSIGDMPNEFNNGTQDTNISILSALNNAIIHLRNTNPNTTIVWIKTWRTDTIDTEIINVFNAVENLCHAWAIPVVDLFNECNFTLQNNAQKNVYGRVNPPILNKGTRDGTHLSPEGYDKVMAPIEAVLNAHVNK